MPKCTHFYLQTSQCNNAKTFDTKKCKKRLTKHTFLDTMILKGEFDMERKIYKDLLEWKNRADRKPLILQGARQVGKTYIVNYFAGKEYENSIYCNFEKYIV